MGEVVRSEEIGNWGTSVHCPMNISKSPVHGPRVIMNNYSRTVRYSKRKIAEQNESKEFILLSFQLGARG